MTRRFLLLLVPLLLGHCSRSSGTASGSGTPRESPAPLPAALADAFSGEHAYRHLEELDAIGPRPPGSGNYETALGYLEEQLAAHGWTTTRQTFQAATPEGPTRFTNLLARHRAAPAPPRSLPVIVGGHLDTKKLPFPFTGANDSGSSTGVLLELARVLSTDPAAASQVELVFFDGEEAFRPSITPRDGLYGSKFFARSLATRPSWPALGIVLDIVGDPDHELLFNPEAPEAFRDSIARNAAALDFPAGLERAPGPIIDDHIPLQNTGLPCLHLIGNFQAMDYWHQAGDTLDKVDPSMLEKVGRLTLRFLADPAVAEAAGDPES